MFADVVMFEPMSDEASMSDDVRSMSDRVRRSTMMFAEVLTAQRSPTMFADVAMSQGSMADVPKFV
jgi:hypothetical protein